MKTLFTLLLTLAIPSLLFAQVPGGTITFHPDGRVEYSMPPVASTNMQVGAAAPAVHFSIDGDPNPTKSRVIYHIMSQHNTGYTWAQLELMDLESLLSWHDRMNHGTVAMAQPQVRYTQQVQTVPQVQYTQQYTQPVVQYTQPVMQYTQPVVQYQAQYTTGTGCYWTPNGWVCPNRRAMRRNWFW